MEPTRSSARSFGKYALVARIAKGGMAEILLARLQGAAGFAKLVCIKRILPHLVEDPHFVQMFLGEARIAAMISHQNVCQVFELGEIDGNYFIAMEYLEGVPLAVFRKPELYPQPPDPALVVAIGIQACEGLHHAHQLTRADGSTLDVVHRDVSGQNLFVTSSGVVKVLDFGIAKAQDVTMRTSTGALKGTYAYMAPEQLRGEPVDRRADVFAMGIVMWETLAQRTLFRRDTEFLTFQAITSEPIPDIRTVRPELPPALCDAIGKALARDRNDRFASARAFADALGRTLQPASTTEIGDEVGRAFASQLRDQRGLARLAHAGVQIDLASEATPGTDLDTAMTTPASDLRVPLVLPVTVRSETLPARPAAPPSRIGVIVATAIIAVGVGAVVLYLTTRTKDAPQVATVSVVSDAATLVATPPDASNADAPIAIDAGTSAQVIRHPPPPPPPPPQVPKKPGFLTIDSSPTYATIFIDGKSYGETPIVKIELSAGKHVIHAVSPTKTTQDQRIVIESGQVAARRIEW